ncbi:hypothetical protein TWF225_011316 [Orbilia oligospora]|nr:hypothetical protein TWF225_011316 [Orbilia oligospora]KAF3244968.1 hypothetical protein TWF217_010590 [Orbilia oligospora]KAF3265907.1 hypothetical protein TWF128_011487 [Orbilia oligospora]
MVYWLSFTFDKLFPPPRLLCSTLQRLSWESLDAEHVVHTISPMRPKTMHPRKLHLPTKTLTVMLMFVRQTTPSTIATPR